MNVFNAIGKPVWLAVMCIAFIWFWPLGIAILGYLVLSGRLGSFMPNTKWWQPLTWVTSGNAAFDEHRAEVMSQLEQERKDFDEFIAEAAKAKDRTEFDNFMKKRSKK
jgi:hypothetical protein